MDVKHYFLFFILCLWLLEAQAHKPSAAHEDSNKPHLFEENKGQLPDHVLYRMKKPGAYMYMEKNGMTWQLLNTKSDNEPGCGHPHSCSHREEGESYQHVFKIEFEGTGGIEETQAKHPSERYLNYIKGNNPEKWASFVREYQQIEMIGVYPGIDMRMYGVDEGLKYDWIVRPGANPNGIELNYSYIEGLEIINGDLHIYTSLETVVEKAPFAYQIVKGKQVEVPCSFKLNGSSVSYNIGDYSENLPLIIDPTLVFSTYTGSTGDNWGMTATPGQNDEFYAGGAVFEPGYPVTNGAVQVRPGGIFRAQQQGDPNLTDIAISKYSADGGRQEFATYLGGQESEVVHSIIANSRNELVLLSTTSSPDFPTTRDAQSRSFRGGNPFIANAIDYRNGSDIAVTVLSADGSAIVGSTFVGGSENDGINNQQYLLYNYGDQFRGEVIVDEADNILVASSTQSSDFPTTNTAFDNRLNGDQDACFFSLNRQCSDLLFSSFLGGGNEDSGYGIKVNSAGEIYVAGGTRSNDFPTLNGANPTYNGGVSDGFLTRFSPDGSTMLSGNFVGTDAYDQIYLLAMDFDDQVYISGQSRGDMPVSNNSYSNNNGSQFIQKYNADLSSLERSTVFGSGRNTIDISLTALTVDSCQRVFVSGWGGVVNNQLFNPGLSVENSSTDGLDVSSDAFRRNTDGSDFYFLVLERDFESLIYATFFGRIDEEGTSQGDHVDGGTSRFSDKGVIYQAVCAACGGFDDFPTTNGAFSNINGTFSGCNLAAVKFDFELTELIAGADLELDTFGCAPYNAQFINESFGANAYQWYFGDGDSSSLRNPAHVYQDTGTYPVQLIALTDNSCLEPDTIAFDIVILEPPIPESDTVVLCDQPSVLLASRRDEPNSIYEWNGGSNRRSIIAFSSGIYAVTASESNCQYIDTFDVSLINPEIELEDTIACGFDAFDIGIDERASDILWSTGDTEPNITVLEDGLYTVSYQIAICPYTDSAYISFAQEPDIEIIGDSIICEGESIILEVRNNSTATIRSYLWSNSATGQQIEISTPGLYEVVATTDSNCVDVVSSNIELLPFIPILGQNDTLICDDSELIIDYSAYEEIAQISWSDGSTESIRNFDEPGRYGFRINNFCQDIDGFVELSISPFEKTDEPIYVPNAFTPNNDGINDVFKAEKAVEMEIRSYLFMVFDRWGNKIYESRNIQDGWDGTFQGQEMDPAIFAYHLEAEYFICEEPQTITISGDVSLQK